MLFYLMERGVPEQFIYGYHDGWPFDKLMRLFNYHKGRELERQKQDAISVAVGAASIVGMEGLKKFLGEIDKALAVVKKDDPMMKVQRARQDVEALTNIFRGG